MIKNPKIYRKVIGFWNELGGNAYAVVSLMFSCEVDNIEFSQATQVLCSYDRSADKWTYSSGAACSQEIIELLKPRLVK